MKPYLSIIVPVRSGRTHYIDFINSFQRQLGFERAELLLVANPRPFPRESSPKSSPRVQLLHSRRAGVNFARNLGAEKAKGEWLYFVDDDCSFVDVHHLQRLASVLADAHPGEILGGGYLLTEENASPASRAYHATQERWIRSGFHAEYGWIHFLGGNLLLHHSAFKAARFDSGIIFGGAETDLVHRLLRTGFRGRFLPDFSLAHFHHLRPEELARKAYLQGFQLEKRRSARIDILPQVVSFAGLRSRGEGEIEEQLRLYQYSFERGRHDSTTGAKLFRPSSGPALWRAFILRRLLRPLRERQRFLSFVLSWIRQGA